MTTSPNVLAVIPARGGSKRFPRKNIYPLRGHPLIAYTIKAAQDATRLTDWLVSTDDEEIAEAARRRDVGRGEQRVDVVEREAARHRGHAARRLQIVGGVVRQPSRHPQELEEAAGAGDETRGGGRRSPFGHRLADERVEVGAIEESAHGVSLA